jgi:hypothetical protein
MSTGPPSKGPMDATLIEDCRPKTPMSTDPISLDDDNDYELVNFITSSMASCHSGTVQGKILNLQHVVFLITTLLSHFVFYYWVKYKMSVRELLKVCGVECPYYFSNFFCFEKLDKKSQCYQKMDTSAVVLKYPIIFEVIIVVKNTKSIKIPRI